MKLSFLEKFINGRSDFERSYHPGRNGKGAMNGQLVETLKVFAMNDCDWMAGGTLEECKAEYLRKYTGEHDPEAFDDPHEVPADRMAKMKFHDDGTVRTFAEQLQRMIHAGEKFPTFFASTEY